MPGTWWHPNHQPFLFQTTCHRDFQLGREGPLAAEHSEPPYSIMSFLKGTETPTGFLPAQGTSCQAATGCSLRGWAVLNLPGVIKLSASFLELQQPDKLIVSCWNQHVSKVYAINSPSASFAALLLFQQRLPSLCSLSSNSSCATGLQVQGAHIRFSIASAEHNQGGVSTANTCVAHSWDKGIF